MSITINNDQSIYHRFINENKGWRKMLKLQEEELPVMEKQLADAIYNPATISRDEDVKANLFFRDSFNHHAGEQRQLHEMLEAQQQRLNTDCTEHTDYDIETMCNQEILRDRMCAAEQHFAVLKSNFMTYLSIILK